MQQADFTQQLALPASKQFYHFETGEKDENWFLVGSKLGVDFAIIKAGGRRAAVRARRGVGTRARGFGALI